MAFSVVFFLGSGCVVSCSLQGPPAADRLEALIPVPLDSSSKQFLTSLQLLDTTPYTEANKVGLLYVTGAPVGPPGPPWV